MKHKRNLLRTRRRLSSNAKGKNKPSNKKDYKISCVNQGSSPVAQSTACIGYYTG